MSINPKPTCKDRGAYILDFKLKGLLFLIISKQSLQPQDIICNQLTEAIKAKVSIQGKQDLYLVSRLAWHLKIQRFSQDLFSLSGMNYTDANALSLQKRLDCISLTQACWWNPKKSKTSRYFSDPLLFKSHWQIRKWGVETNTDYWHP